MTGEPLSAQHSPNRPSDAAEHISLAERFASFGDYAAHTESSPERVAATLDVARFHAFTGELTFSVDSPVRLYLDGGSIYFAERDGDPSVSRLLLDAGVIDSVQLQRGVVRIGDVDHLGRLFDRDSTVDRDAVMVLVESATEAMVQRVANAVTATVASRAYRHHPSGLHRWFVAPCEPTALRRPSSGVMQIDRSVVEDLPRLGAPDGKDFDPGLDASVATELEHFDADRADWAESADRPTPEVDGGGATDEFHVVWPDGTREHPIATPAPDTPPDPTADRTLSPPAQRSTPAPHGPAALPPPEPIHIERLPEPGGSIPGDVAAAVRRALHALGSETARDHPASPLGEQCAPESSVPGCAPEMSAPAVEPEPPVFAPPTPDMRAEVIYERVTADRAAAAARAAATAGTISPEVTEPAIEAPQPRNPDSDATSPVASDVPDRRSALRRLIGSLRNTD